MEHKCCALEVKDFSAGNRTAIICHSVYGNIDLVGDISTKGMFSSSWERKDAISFYFNHDDSRSPGSVTRTFEDEQKAYTEVKFGEWTEGNDVMKMIEHGGVIRGASFGFETEKKDFIKKNDRAIRVLRQVKHLETSLLTKQPANPLAGIVSFTKQADIINEWKAHIERMESFCRNTNASDNTIINILGEIKGARLILSKYDTASTPLITDGDASRNDSFHKQLLLLNMRYT